MTYQIPPPAMPSVESEVQYEGMGFYSWIRTINRSFILAGSTSALVIFARIVGGAWLTVPLTIIAVGGLLVSVAYSTTGTSTSRVTARVISIIAVVGVLLGTWDAFYLLAKTRPVIVAGTLIFLAALVFFVMASAYRAQQMKARATRNYFQLQRY